MRSARGKQLLRLQRFCAPAWLRVGAGSTFGARGFEGQPLGDTWGEVPQGDEYWEAGDKETVKEMLFQ